MGDDALTVAHEAKNMATRAMARIDALEPHLSTIAMNVEGLRRENADQHRENARLNKDNFDQVHTRISTVKQTIDQNRTASAIEIKAVDDKLTSKINSHASLWARHKDKAFWFMVAMLLGLLGDKLGVHLEVFGG